jgi:hypothetical protein
MLLGCGEAGLNQPALHAPIGETVQQDAAEGLGVSPNLHLFSPKIGGQGVEQGAKTPYQMETWSSARPKALSTVCLTPSVSIIVPEYRPYG